MDSKRTSENQKVKIRNIYLYCRCESCNIMYGDIGETMLIYVKFLLLFNIRCVKNVRIRIFSVPYFPAFGMWENSDQKNCEYGQL